MSTEAYYNHQLIQWHSRINELKRMKGYIDERLNQATTIVETLRKNRMEEFK